MTRKPKATTRPGRSRSTTILAVGIPLTVAVLGALTWAALDSHRAVTNLLDTELRLQALRGTILHLDEVLTHSARMAVATGDGKWQKRYRAHQPALEAAIQEANRLAPAAYESKAAALTKEAGLRRVELEHRAFELLAERKYEAAGLLLSGEAYEQQKDVYANAMAALDASLTRHTQGRIEHHRKQAMWTGVAGLLTLVALVAGWITLLLAARTKELARANQAMAIEIAERHKVEEALRRSKDYVDGIVQSMIDMLVVVSPEGKIITVNHATCRALGYREEELIGRPAVMLCSRDESAQAAEAGESLPFEGALLDRLMKDGAIAGTQKSFCSKDGRQIPALLSSSLMRDGKGTIRGIVCIARDITERQRLEAEALEINRNLHAVNRVHLPLFQAQTACDVATTLTEALVRDFDAHFARVWLIRPGDRCSRCALAGDCPAQERCLHLVSSSGHYTHIDGDHGRVPLGVFKIGQIAQGRGKTICHDVVNDPTVHDRAWAAELGLRSFVGLPLVRDGQVIGVMAMFSKRDLPDHLLEALELLGRVGTSAFANVEGVETLRESEDRYMECVFSAADATLLIDGEKFVECNEKTVEMLRASSKEEVLATHPSELSPATQPDGRPSFEKANEMMATAFERGSHRFEWVHCRLDGEVFPVEVTLMPVLLSGKRLLYCMWKDITAQKHAEERVRKLSLAVEQSPASIVIADTQGRIEYVNPRFCEVSGYSVEEVVGLSPDLLEAGIWPQGADDALWGRILAGKVWTGESENRRKNGELYWEATSIRPIRNADGAVTHLLAVKQDISERKRAEEKLSRIQMAVDDATDAILIADKDGKVGYVNIAFTDMFNCTLDMINEDGWESIYVDPAAASKILNAIEGLDNWTGEIEMVSKRGKAFTAAVRATPIVGAEALSVGVLLFIDDITERKEAEDQLRSAHAEVNRLFSSISSALVAVDEHECIRQWNIAAEKMFGMPAVEVFGREFRECRIDWDWSVVLDGIRRCRKEDRTLQLEEVRFQRQDGTDGFLAVALSPVEGGSDRSCGFLLVASDITEQKALQSQLSNAQKLESIGQLAAGIAHEINTPIQYVGDNARFLQESMQDLITVMDRYAGMLEVDPPSPDWSQRAAEIKAALEELDVEFLKEEIPKAIEQSLEGADRVARIVRAMKDFSHPGGEGKEAVDLGKAIESTITVARNEWKYVAEMVMDFDPDLPPVPCLVGEFNQVILNLVINAAHAIADVVQETSGEKGTITITTRQDGAWAEIRIGDTGTGIPEEHRAKVFDHFFTTKEIGKGTGQGLAIAYGVITEKHDGTITLESEMGKGTTFIIRLPVESPPATAEAPPGHEATDSFC